MAKRKAVDGASESKSKSQGSRKSVEIDATDRVAIVSRLCTIKGVAKMGLARTLKALHDKDLLNDSLVSATSLKGYQRQVQKAIEKEALYAQTPYGILLREMDLPTGETKSRSLYYIHPKALIYRVCQINNALFNLFKAIIDVGIHVLQIILFLDGINPGNPVAPDPQKLLQGIYWTFLELPNWFLRRKDSWFAFSLGRELHINNLAGGLSELVTMIIAVFFDDDAHSFKTGVMLSNSDESEKIVFDVEFAGFMCDEKGHKQNLGIKGQAGNTICFDCRNCKNRWCDLEPDQQYYWDPDLSKRKPMTTKHFKAVTKRIARFGREGQTTERELLEKLYGINWIPTGLLFSAFMHTVVDVERCYIRDWMHTLVSDGVICTEIALLVQAFLTFGFGTTTLQKFATQFTFPHKITGNPSRFFKPELMTTDHVKHFASDTLTMSFLMIGFLFDQVVVDVDMREGLAKHVECFKNMFIILCILRRGDMSQSIANRLASVIDKHARLFLEIYGDEFAKPKFHHLYHLVEDCLKMMQCLSCFPTERKNKDALDLANANDRKVEKTAVIKFLHQTLEHWYVDTCQQSSMVDSCVRSLGETTVVQSKSATLKGGEVHYGDLVALSDGRVAQVASFYKWEHDHRIYAQVEAHERISDFNFAIEFETDFVDVALIVEPLIWYRKPRSIFAVVPMY